MKSSIRKLVLQLVILGGGAGWLLLSMGASPAAPPPQGEGGSFQIRGVPTPSQMVYVVGGPYVVPTGKTLVVTGLTGSAILSFNGQQVMSLNDAFGNGITAIPPGVAAPQGTNVELAVPTGFLNIPVLTGYLDDGPGVGLEVGGFPNADQMVRLTGEGPFVVPAGFQFVVTGLAGTGDQFGIGPFEVGLQLNGQEIVTDTLTDGIIPVPPGVVAGPGTVITTNCGAFGPCQPGAVPVLLGYATGV